MGKWEETREAYYSRKNPGEKTVPGKDKNKICSEYVGVSCVDGSCPIANADTYAEYGMDVIRTCEDCWMYKGCKDCALYGTDLCESPMEEVET